MEPGTFKDRLLLECDPHQLIEGMICAAYTIQADLAYIFIRAEYHKAAGLLREAIAACYAQGYLGKNILGSDYSLDIQVHSSAGRYICGEETALISSLEGKRANPRAKPPFPQVSGLWGRPTIVNNVETLCNVHHIIERGAEWFQALGLTEDAGTKLYGVSGRVKKPGCWELPMGTPIREIIEHHAGGMEDGYRLRGFLPGGGSTDFLTPEHLDLAMDYGIIGKAGSRMGTGTMIVLDDKTCPVGFVKNLMEFFARESCGFCTPCRDGLPWSAQVLDDIERGRGRPEDMDTLARQVEFIGAIGNTHCALAPGAMEPLQSAMKYFREDFDRHISGSACPFCDRGTH
jgi:NADH-quinone oxidoreductase subunit F